MSWIMDLKSIIVVDLVYHQVTVYGTRSKADGAVFDC